MKKIILRRKVRNTEVLINQNYLMQECKIKETYLRTTARPYYKKNGKTWKWEKIGRGFYYDYDFLPDKYKMSLGSKEEIIKLASIDMPLDEIKRIAKKKLKKIYASYEMEHSKVTNWYYINNYDDSRQRAEAYLWCKILVKYTNKDTRKWVTLGIDKIMEVYECVVEILREREEEIKGLRVGSVTSLYNKLKGFENLSRKEQLELFVHKGLGNDNREVLTEKHKHILISLRGSSMNYTDRQVVDKGSIIFNSKGLDIPTRRTIEKYINSREVLVITEISRYGERSNSLKINNGTLPIDKPIYAGDCIQMDGTRLNVIPHILRDETGKIIGEKFIKIVVARDVYSGVVLGYSLGYEENHSMYINALSMAVENLGGLPFELVIDRFPGHNSDQWGFVREGLESMGVKITETSFATGKAQVERFFGTFQSVFLSESPFYYGEGITSKRKISRRSTEHQKEVKKLAKIVKWDYDLVCSSTEKYLEKYNTTPFIKYSRNRIEKSPINLLEESKKANTILIDKAREMWLFAFKTKLKVRAGGMLKATIQKVDYHYRIDDAVMDYAITNKYSEVLFCYDPLNPKNGFVFNSEGDFLIEVKEVEPIQIYGANADNGKLKSERTKNKKILEYNKNRYKEILSNTEKDIAELDPFLTSKKELEKAEDKYLKMNMGVYNEKVEEGEILEEEEEEGILPPIDYSQDFKNSIKPNSTLRQ